ncbi:hypothetical protein [Bacillus pseudomycoides]|uniref:hypothetical protein n=1 Tax=Bacillus pseudomycoides TaxID=64104 RepID=UPI0026830683
MFHTNRLQFRKYPMDDLDFYVSLCGNEQVIRYIGKELPKRMNNAKKALKVGLVNMPINLRKQIYPKTKKMS